MGFGVAALVCGIVGVFLALSPIVFVVGFPLGIGFGAIGIRRAKRAEATKRGMAITGLITGLIAVVIAIIAIARISSAVDSLNNDLNNGFLEVILVSCRLHPSGEHDQRRTKLAHPTFHVYDDKGGHYRWKLISSNGIETAMAAHHFASKQDARRACEELKDHIVNAEIAEDE